jgi:hypothetical protein
VRTQMKSPPPIAQPMPPQTTVTPPPAVTTIQPVRPASRPPPPGSQEKPVVANPRVFPPSPSEVPVASAETRRPPETTPDAGGRIQEERPVQVRRAVPIEPEAAAPRTENKAGVVERRYTERTPDGRTRTTTVRTYQSPTPSKAESRKRSESDIAKQKMQGEERRRAERRSSDDDDDDDDD